MTNDDLPPTIILQPGDMVTGVRGWDGSQVVLTGTIVTEIDGDKVETAMIYCGALVPTDPAQIFKLTPRFPEGPTVDSTFYGPDTWVFNPALGVGMIRAVGTCTFEKGEARNHGMVYHGPPDGTGGSWNLTDMPNEIAGGVVWNTVPHSTMGELIVGNYDLKDRPGSANAYIHDFTTSPWQAVALEGLELVTFYGIWQNGIGSTSYTICGGAKDSLGINQGLLVDYDSATRTFSNQRLYRNPDDALVITHFEGITLAGNGAYHLAAMSDTAALLATVRRLADGSFGEAIWSAPFTWDGDTTTGNTVYQDVLMGVFQQSDSPIQSYAVTPGRIQGGPMAARLRSAAAARSASR
jgi:hypothetical protein